MIGHSSENERLALHLLLDIQAVARNRARIEAALRDIDGASEKEGREKLFNLYQALPQVRVLAATYAVPPDEIRRATQDTGLTEEERKEFSDLSQRLVELRSARERLKEVLPDIFKAQVLPRTALNLVLELKRTDGSEFIARFSGEGIAKERSFDIDETILRDSELITKASEKGGRLAEHTAENLGRSLADRLLGEDAILAIRQAIHEGRRVRIFLPPSTTSVLPIPWESLLRSPGLSPLLPHVALVRGTTLRKSLALKLPSPPPLRILLIISSPLDLGSEREIQVEREREIIMAPLRPLIAQGRVWLKVVDVASRTQIRTAVMEGFHIVHFIGHGQEGGLWIEDEAGRGCSIPASDFAALFTEGRPLMVWLTACRSAVGPRDDPYGSVAEALTKIGIPEVVAMPYSLTYKAGRTLGKAFYEALTLGRGLEESLESARNAVFQDDARHTQADWTIPALFSEAESEPSLEWQESPPLPQRHDWLGGLNRLDRGFVGRRREIRQIKAVLTAGEKRVLVIQGLPGIGKSVLASRVIEDVSSEFSGVFPRTVVRDQNGRSDLNFVGFLRELDYFFRRHSVSTLSEAVAHEEWPLKLKLQLLLEALQARRFLVVLDSAEELLDSSLRFEDPDFEEMFREILAAAPLSQFLFTTQKGPVFRDIERHSSKLEFIPLPELHRHEALELVRLREEFPKLNHTDLQVLLERAQGIPLALVYYLALAREPDRLREALATPSEKAPDSAAQAIRALLKQFPDNLRRAAGRAALFRRAMDRDALKAAGLTPSEIDALKEWSLLLHLSDADFYVMHPHVRLMLAGTLSEEQRKQTHAAIGVYLEGFLRKFSAEHEKTEKEPAQAPEWLARAMHLMPSGSTVDILLEAHYHLRCAGDKEGAATLLEGMAQHLSLTGRLHELDQLIQEMPEQLLARKAWLRVWQARIWNTWGRGDEALQLLNSIQLEPQAVVEAKTAATFDIAEIALKHGDYEAAEESYRQLLAAYPENDKVSSVAYHSFGIIHQHRGDYDNALEWYQKSLALKERLGNLHGIATSYHQIGIIHQHRGDYDNALEWYQKSLALKERLGNLEGIAGSYHQIGMIHQDRGDYDNALEWSQKSLALMERLGNLHGIAAAYCHIGMIHAKKKEFKAAIHATHTAALILDRIGSPDLDKAKAVMAAIIKEIGEEEFRRHLSEILTEAQKK
ncbi:MAG: tetratricopeptide repeat protein [Deltaproteobacteria bacterium]|nr:tetratricopeptide repeat protein [Deltaproteobacteria bacterium]